MSVAGVGRLVARLVDDFGASADEAARIVNNLDPQVARTLDENPQMLETLRGTDDSGRLGSVLSRGGDDAGRSGSFAPQSGLGRTAALGGAGVLGYQGLGVLGDREERLAEEAAQDRTDTQAETFSDILQNDDFSPEDEAEILTALAGSGSQKRASTRVTTATTEASYPMTPRHS